VPEGGLVEALRRAESSPEPVIENRPSVPAIQTRSTMRTPSGVMRLSEMPETDVGEAAARAVTGGPMAPSNPVPEELPPPDVHITLPAAASTSPGQSVHTPKSEPAAPLEPKRGTRPPVGSTPPAPAFTFAPLFPAAEQGVVQVVESALALGDPMAALTAMDQLVARALASGAALAGSTHDAPRDPALVAMLLGVEPRRYLKFRSLVREARAGTLLSVEAGLQGYAFVLDLRRALRDAG
jgi:hypothetical protein